MQPSYTRDDVAYAGIGRRFAAIVIDMVVVLFILVAAALVAALAGALDMAKYRTLTWPPQQTPAWFYVLAYGVVFAYFTLLELRGGTAGKRALGLLVVMDDGSAPTVAAIVVRNLVRIPEQSLYYIPSAISCWLSPRNQRLGDFAAHTVVLRRGVAAARGPLVAHGSYPATASTTPPQGLAPPAAYPAAGAAAPAAATPTSDPLAAADDAVAALKTAALAVHGAHLNYLRFSEEELARGAAPATAAGEPADGHEYAPEYTAAWYTLADAVIALQQARAAADAAAAHAGTTLPAACLSQPDLVHLFRVLEPYFSAGSDEQVHEAYLRVARGETSVAPPG